MYKRQHHQVKYIKFCWGKLHTSNNLTTVSETCSSEPATSKVYSECRPEFRTSSVDMFQIGFWIDASVSFFVTHWRSSVVHIVKTRRWPVTHTTKSALQSVLECLSELAIEVGVDDRVERRIEVPDPEHNSDNFSWAVFTTRITKIYCYIPHEERKPAEDKRSHNYT